MTDWCFVGGSRYEPDYAAQLFEGTDTLLPLDPSWSNLAQVVHLGCGFFKSVSDARRNGWDGPLEAGFNQYRLPGRQNLYVWNQQFNTSDWNNLCQVFVDLWGPGLETEQ